MRGRLGGDGHTSASLPTSLSAGKLILCDAQAASWRLTNKKTVASQFTDSIGFLEAAYDAKKPMKIHRSSVPVAPVQKFERGQYLHFSKVPAQSYTCLPGSFVLTGVVIQCAQYGKNFSNDSRSWAIAKRGAAHRAQSLVAGQSKIRKSLIAVEHQGQVRTDGKPYDLI